MHRRGFSAMDTQHMLPMPLREAARAYAEEKKERNVGCAQNEVELAAQSAERFVCRLRHYLRWRASLPSKACPPCIGERGY